MPVVVFRSFHIACVESSRLVIEPFPMPWDTLMPPTLFTTELRV